MTGCEDSKKSHSSRSTHRPPSNRPVSPRPQEALLRCSHPQARPPGLYSFSESLPRSTGSFSAPDSHWSISHGLFHVHRVALRVTLTAVSLTLSLSQSPSESLSHSWNHLHTRVSFTHTPSLCHTNSVTLTLCVSHTQGHPQTDSLTHTDTHKHTASSSHAQCYTPGVPLTLKGPLTRTASASGTRSLAASLTCPRPTCPVLGSGSRIPHAAAAQSSAPAEHGPGPAPAALLPRPGSPGPAPTARLPRRARPRPVTSWWPGTPGMLGRAAPATAATAQAPPPPRHPPPDRDSARRVGTGRLAPRGARGRRRFRAPGGRRGLWDSAGRAQASAGEVPAPGGPRPGPSPLAD